MTEKEKIKLIQKEVGTTADGIMGPKTLDAVIAALHITATAATIETSADVPTQAEVRSGKSIFGKPGCESSLTSVRLPFPLYFDGIKKSTIRVHSAIADRARAALEEILMHYGAKEIHRLGLDNYGGDYNYRATSTGKSLSMHAWGIALDFDPARNAYSTKAPDAFLSRPECKAFVDIWEKHGFINLGRHAGYDWMHFQFARLK